MGETILDMDIELEQKDKKIHFSEDKIEIEDSKIVEDMKRLDLHKYNAKINAIGL